MSFVSRQLYKQKPQACGPVSSVKASMLKNAEKIGIPAPKAAFPLFEGSGYPRNYMSGEVGTLYGSTAPLWAIGPQGMELVWQASNTGFMFSTGIEGMTYGSNDKWSAFALARAPGSSISPILSPGQTTGSYWHSLCIRYGVTYNPYVTLEVDAYARASTSQVNNNLSHNISIGGANYSNTYRKAWAGINGAVTVKENTSTATNRALITRLGLGIYADGSPVGYTPIINIAFLWPTWVMPDSVFYFLNDNPYYLLHRVPPVFYSVPGGGGTIYSVLCSDGFTFADTTTKTALLQAAAIESINLSDSDENVAQFIASLINSFSVADLTTKTATHPVSVSDAFSVSDTTTVLQKVIAMVSDSVTFLDVSVVRADLTGIAEDNVQFSATLVATLQAQAIAAEIINLSDTAISRADLTAQIIDDFTVSAATTEDVLGVLSGLCSVTFNVSDTPMSRADLLAAIIDALDLSDVASALLTAQAQVADSFTLDDASTWANIATALIADGFIITGDVTCRVDLVSALVDSMNLSDTAAAILTAYATATDGLTVSDNAFWAGVIQAIASDSFTISGSMTGLIKLLAQAAETIKFSDSGSVTAIYNVRVNDAVEFATAISTIAQFRAVVVDGFNVTATPMEVSQLPTGKVSVSFSIKVPGADFSMKTATIVFNIK